mmetsp:Transcript_70942/g.200228  ORF Transcript_70942/g.200228 Transcript_70942/m.200228 type:complete len:259 (-) Transcript_70942:360-1136(-)
MPSRAVLSLLRHFSLISAYSGDRTGCCHAGVVAVPVSGCGTSPNHSAFARQRIWADSRAEASSAPRVYARSFTLGNVNIIGTSMGGTPKGSSRYLRTPSKTERPFPTGKSSMFAHSRPSVAAEPLMPMLAITKPAPCFRGSSPAPENLLPGHRRAVFRQPQAETTQWLAKSWTFPAWSVVSTPTARPLSSRRIRSTGARTKQCPPRASRLSTRAAPISPVPPSGYAPPSWGKPVATAAIMKKLTRSGVQPESSQRPQM